MDKAKQIKIEYVEAAYKLLCEQDFDEISIRQLAKITKRNSATLYYYFEDLNNLLTIASVRYLMEYYDILSTVVNSSFKILEINLLSWGCLACCAFKNPPIYENFFLRNPERSEKAFYEYLVLFPEEKEIVKHYFLGEQLYSSDLRQRDKWMLKKAVGERMISEESAEYLGNFDYYLFFGMVSEVRYKKCSEKEVSETQELFMEILTETYRKCLLPGCAMLDCHLKTIMNDKN